MTSSATGLTPASAPASPAAPTVGSDRPAPALAGSLSGPGGGPGAGAGSGPTDVDARHRPRALPPWSSVRVRILGWQLLLVAVALGVSVGLSYRALLVRADERVDRGLATSAGEFRRFAETGLDPTTSRPFTDVRRVLDLYLTANVPDRNETMVAIVDGAPYRRSAEEPVYRLDTDQATVAAFAAPAEPAFGTVDTPAGEVRFVAVPVVVAGAPEQGVFVDAAFRDRERSEVTEAVRVLALVGFGALGLAGIVGWLVAGRVLAPVRLLRGTAQAISETDLSRRIPERGNDEIADLAATFNGMLDRLEQAFATQRSFVDDAGHELRTPITVVRGHLELLGDDPAERAETVALVTDELDRMSRMVDDLLTLARAERPDFLRHDVVDAVALLREVHTKATALARRDWRLDLDAFGELAAASDLVVVLADRQRLTQALVQLAQNATQHTEVGDEIRLGLAAGADTVRFWVADDGPGVPAADRERIFERFSRGSAARRTDQDGAGLGLAIVRAIAVAHGGWVWVEGRPGQGARFVVAVPRRPAGGDAR